MKGGLDPGAPGDVPVLRLQLQPNQSEEDKARLEEEHLKLYFQHAAHPDFKHLQDKNGKPLQPRIEWVE